MNENVMYPMVRQDSVMDRAFLEECVIDLDRLNEITTQRRYVVEQNRVAHAKAVLRRKKEQARIARQKGRATRRLIVQELTVLTGMAVVGYGTKAGLVAAMWAFPVLVFFLTVIVFTAGKYFGKHFPR